MIVDDKIRDGKLQYDANKEVAKISALSSSKIGKYISQEKIYCLLIKVELQNKLSFHILLQETLEKQIKTIESQGGEEIKAMEKQAVKSKIFSDEINELVFSH